jgi:hypothetical protein
VSCETDDSCRAGEACFGGRCVVPVLSLPCGASEECGDGLRCVEGACDLPAGARPCRDDGECLEGNGCEDGLCASLGAGRPCAADEDCVEGLRCAGGACAAPGGGPCATHDDCPIATTCNAGRCTAAGPPPCDAEESCDGGAGCDAGVCRVARPCRDDNDCGFRAFCASGECAPSGLDGRVCVFASDCGPSQVCATGLCADTTEDGRTACFSDADCGGGFGACGDDGRCADRPGEFAVCGTPAATACPTDLVCHRGECDPEELPDELGDCEDLEESCAAPFLGCWGPPPQIVACSGERTPGGYYNARYEHAGGQVYETRLGEGDVPVFDYYAPGGMLCARIDDVVPLDRNLAVALRLRDEIGTRYRIYLWPDRLASVRCEDQGIVEWYRDITRCPLYQYLGARPRGGRAVRPPACGLPGHACGDAQPECLEGLACCPTTDDEITGERICLLELTCTP